MQSVMQSVWFIWIVVFLVIFLAYRQEQLALKIRRKHRRRKDGIDMNELIRRFLGKNCIIYLSGGFGGDLEGVVETVEGSWVSVRTKKTTELINLDYICRIKEKVAK